MQLLKPHVFTVWKKNPLLIKDFEQSLPFSLSVCLSSSVFVSLLSGCEVGC